MTEEIKTASFVSLLWYVSLPSPSTLSEQQSFPWNSMLGVTGPLYNVIILILLFCLSDEFLNA